VEVGRGRERRELRELVVDVRGDAGLDRARIVGRPRDEARDERLDGERLVVREEAARVADERLARRKWAERYGVDVAEDSNIRTPTRILRAASTKRGPRGGRAKDD